VSQEVGYKHELNGLVKGFYFPDESPSTICGSEVESGVCPLGDTKETWSENSAFGSHMIKYDCTTIIPVVLLLGPDECILIKITYSIYLSI